MRTGRMYEVGKIVCEQADVRPPDEGDVLVRTHYASICGSDLHMVVTGAIVPPLPAAPGFPGHEGVGEIVESRHPDFFEGDRVLTYPNSFVGTCFSEYQTLGAEYCLKLPEGEERHLLMAQQLGTVIWALRRVPVDVTGKSIAIIGQGSAGLFFTWLLKRAGAEVVIVSDLSPARLEVAKRFGADVTVDANAGGEVMQQAVLETTGVGADYAIEAVGSKETFRQSTALPRLDGHLLWFGLPDGPDDAAFNYGEFFRKRLIATSSWGAQDEPGRSSFKRALGLISRGDIDVTPLLSHVLPIERIDEAFEIAHERRDGALKVSISF